MRLITLGRVELEGVPAEAASAILAQPKRLALLLLLTENGGLQTRDRLLALLWPDLPERRARRALSQALSFLRRHLGQERVHLRSRQEVGVSADSVWWDGAAVRLALREGRDEEAVELYEGPLLPGFHLTANGEFSRWLETSRKELHDGVVTALRRLASTRREAGDHEGAAAAFRRLLILAPYDEPAAGELVRLLVERGDRAGALSEYEAFAARLATDLELETSAELEKAVAELGPASTTLPRPSPVVPIHPTPVNGSRGAEDTGSRAVEGVEVPVRRHRSQATAVAVTAAVVLGGVFLWSLMSRPAPPAASPARHVALVAPLANETGDQDLDALGRVAADWLTTGLSRTGLTDVVSQFTVLGRLVGYEESQRRVPAPIELARDHRATLLVSGSYHAVGDSLRFQATVTDVATERVVRAIEGPLVARATPGDAIEPLRRQLMGAIGTAVDPRFSAWSQAASQPPSYEAYRLYAQGMDLFTRDDRDEAAPFFARAAAEDPSFTMALVWQAFAVHDDAAARDAIVTLLLARDDLEPLDYAAVRYLYAYNHEHKRDALEWALRMVELAPESEWRYKVGLTARLAGDPVLAARVLEQIRPSGWLAGAWGEVAVRDVLASSYDDLGRLDDRLQLYKHAPPGPLDYDSGDPAWAAAAVGDSALTYSWLANIDEWVLHDRISLTQALGTRAVAGQYAYVTGHDELARRLRADNLLWYEDFRERTGTHDPYWVGILLYEAGQYARAGESFEVAYCAAETEATRLCSLWRGLVAAHLEDRPGAERALSRLEAVQDREALADRARIHTVLGDVSEARALLRRYYSIGGGVPLQRPDWRNLWPREPLPPEEGFAGPIPPWVAWSLQVRR